MLVGVVLLGLAAICLVVMESSGAWLGSARLLHGSSEIGMRS